MKVAVIGAGLAGLATAYFLSEFEEISVTVFEEKGIGAGASGAASGLLHPYPGIMARHSAKAEEAMEVTKQLLRVAETFSPRVVSSHVGILRKSLSREQKIRLCQHQVQYGDVEQMEEDLFWIHSGITVQTLHYLEGLAEAFKKRGGTFQYEKISTLKQLSDFDHVVMAAGYGIAAFEECRALRVKFLKGQALCIEGSPQYEKSYISKGYIAHLGDRSYFELGSTYEREFDSVAPDLEVAKALLQDKLCHYPDHKILGCKAGVRVCPKEHYLPIIEKVAENVTVFTGLGSRGLLYHGYYGRMLANRIAQNTKIA